MYTDAELERFLDESLPADRMAAIETALRDDEALQSRIASAVGRRDAGVHSLGEVWRRHRLTCPSREQLGSYLLGVLEAGVEDYVRFHIETVACRLCAASLQDLQAQNASAAKQEAAQRRSKYFQSSAGYLSNS
jgi:hypothetical protein